MHCEEAMEMNVISCSARSEAALGFQLRPFLSSVIYVGIEKESILLLFLICQMVEPRGTDKCQLAIVQQHSEKFPPKENWNSRNFEQ